MTPLERDVLTKSAHQHFWCVKCNKPVNEFRIIRPIEKYCEIITVLCHGDVDTREIPFNEKAENQKILFFRE